MTDGVKCFSENLNQQGDKEGLEGKMEEMIVVSIKSCRRNTDKGTFEKVLEDMRHPNSKCLVFLSGL